ncbi:hypothetical protein EXS70_02070 [Candidatus Peribacteria bacterium]|nr:hypothetical protein [Candidatus Peribacteria bacterium]
MIGLHAKNGRLEQCVVSLERLGEAETFSDRQSMQAVDFSREIVYRASRISESLRNKIIGAFTRALEKIPDDFALKPLLSACLQRFHQQIERRTIIVFNGPEDSFDDDI